MKPTFAKPFFAVIGAVALSATLFGCTPATTPEEEMASISHAPVHMSAKEFKAIHLSEAQDADRYSISFDNFGWTGNYLSGSMSKNLNFFVTGTFTNKTDERYRLGSSSEAEFEMNNTYALYADTSLLDGEVMREDSYVYPGETVSFITRAAIPTAMHESITSVTVPFTLFSAGFENGIYSTHSSSIIGAYIFTVEPQPTIAN